MKGVTRHKGTRGWFISRLYAAAATIHVGNVNVMLTVEDLAKMTGILADLLNEANEAREAQAPLCGARKEFHPSHQN